MVDGYRIQYAYFVDHDNPEFKAPWNQIRNVPRVFTPDDKVVQIPNSDTPYSTLGPDLRAEPMVITVPPIEKSRYYSVQLMMNATPRVEQLLQLTKLKPKFEICSVPEMLDLLCRAIHQSVPAITAFKADSTPHSKLVVQHLDWQPHLL